VTGPVLGGEPTPSEVEELDLPTFAAERITEEGGAAGGNTSGDTSVIQKGEEPPLFIMSEALPVVPGKLVKRILRGEYIEMSELLKVDGERCQILRAGCNASVHMPPSFAASSHTRRGSCGCTRPL